MQSTHKFTKFLLIVFLGALVFAPGALAHNGGMSVVTINGQEANILNSLNLPLDASIASYHDYNFANEKFKVNQKIKFGLIQINLRVIQDYIQDCEFIWDFGDGSQQVTKADMGPTHAYKKAGIYTAKLYVKFPDSVMDAVENPSYIKSIALEIIADPNAVPVLKTTAIKQPSPKPEPTLATVPAADSSNNLTSGADTVSNQEPTMVASNTKPDKSNTRNILWGLIGLTTLGGSWFMYRKGKIKGH